MATEPTVCSLTMTAINDGGILTLLTCVGRGGFATPLACQLRSVCRQLASNLRNDVFSTAASTSTNFWANASIPVLSEAINRGAATITFDAAINVCERRDIGSVAALLAIGGRRPHCTCHPPGEHPSPAEKRGITAAMLQRLFEHFARTATCGLDVFKLLLADARVNPGNDDGAAIRWASSYGHLEFVRALMDDARVNPAAQDNAAVGRAGKYGHLDVLNLLLTDGRVNPIADDNYALRWASFNGHVGAVRRLLADARIDPSDKDALENASENGWVDVLRVLLADPRADPATPENYALTMACKRGHLDAVALLLADGRIDPGIRDNESLQFALYSGHHLVVRLLLNDHRIDPTVGHVLVIAAASTTACLRELLSDPRVDPGAGGNAALVDAIKRGCSENITMILDDQRVDLANRTDNPLTRLTRAIVETTPSKLQTVLSHARIDGAMVIDLLVVAVFCIRGEALQALLSHSKAAGADVPSWRRVMHCAFAHSRSEMLRILLVHPQLLAASAGDDPWLARVACRYCRLATAGQADILRALLDDERFPLHNPATDPGCGDLLSSAIDSGKLETVQIVLGAPRVRQRVQIDVIETLAAKAETTGRDDMAQMLRSQMADMAVHDGT